MREEARPAAPETDRAALSRTSRRAWRHATLLAFAALACGVLLGGLSAWFLGAVAIAGLSAATALTFNFHAPGALVRLFAIGRTVARYGERLSGHKGALTDQVLRRADLFGAMADAPATRRAGWQLGDQARLSDYLDDVEDIDFGKLRADLPAATMAFGTVALLGATLFAAPLAALPIAAALAVCAAMAHRLAGKAGHLVAALRAAGRDGGEALGAAAASVVPLRAEDGWNAAAGAALSAFSEADTLRRRLRNAQAGLDAICSLIGPLAGGSVIAIAWLGGARDGALLVPVFVAFAWLAMAEVFQGASRLVVANTLRKLAAREVAGWGSPAPPGKAEESGIDIPSLSHPGLQRRTPDGRPLGAPLALDLSRGPPTVLVGASGSGKTSLLKQIAGWIGDDDMRRDGGAAATPQQRRDAVMFCLHDAAILADTVRANLFAPGADDAGLWAALETVEMDARIREAGGLDGWITQETLSMGEAQRLNLARALLSSKPVILLDEPAEHLDAAQAGRIVARLFDRLCDRIVVATSHRALPLAGGQIVDLDAADQPRSAFQTSAGSRASEGL